MNDLHLALKRLARSPGFTLLVAGFLALGIGTSTAIFSLFDAVLLRPLPVRHPEELVRMVQYIPKLGARDGFPYPYYQALRDHAKTLAFTFGGWGDYERFVMSDPGPAEEVNVDGVTSEFFQALGVPALYGRALLPSDAKEERGTPPAVLSYSFWKRRFGGERRAFKGRTIVVDKHHFAIVGVMPRDFDGLRVDTAPDVWIPFRALLPLLDIRVEEPYVELAALLKPGVTRLQAQAECRTIWQSTMKDYYQNVEKLPPQTVRALFRQGVGLDPLARGTSILRDQFGGVLELLMASVGVLLLIVCTNVAGLLLARAAARQQEFAVLLAVGATRFRLVRHVLTEGFLLAMLGAAGGLLITLASMPLALHMLPPMRDLNTSLVPLSLNAGINGRVFLFLLAVSVLTMLLFSLGPAIAVSRSNIESLLRAARTSSGVRGRQAGVGIYGLLAYVVTERRREIGIRMALGAQPADIAKLVAVQTLAMTAAGSILGLGAALMVGPGIRSLLYGISPQDPKSLVLATLFVALVAAVATVFPAVRAIRTQPSETLRCEQ